MGTSTAALPSETMCNNSTLFAAVLLVETNHIHQKSICPPVNQRPVLNSRGLNRPHTKNGVGCCGHKIKRSRAAPPSPLPPGVGAAKIACSCLSARFLNPFPTRLWYYRYVVPWMKHLLKCALPQLLATAAAAK